MRLTRRNVLIGLWGIVVAAGIAIGVGAFGHTRNSHKSC